MWFDVQAALAEIEGGEIPAPWAGRPATSATPATKPACVAIVATVATPSARHPDADTPEAAPRVVTSETFPHGVSVAGKPCTWTGRVVSLDAWRRLSEWERHGPNGRHWDGITRNWIKQRGE